MPVISPQELEALLDAEAQRMQAGYERGFLQSKELRDVYAPELRAIAAPSRALQAYVFPYLRRLLAREERERSAMLHEASLQRQQAQTDAERVAERVIPERLGEAEVEPWNPGPGLLQAEMTEMEIERQKKAIEEHMRRLLEESDDGDTR